MELVEGLWQPLRELSFNYSGISVASALRVSKNFSFPKEAITLAECLRIVVLADCQFTKESKTSFFVLSPIFLSGRLVHARQDIFDGNCFKLPLSNILSVPHFEHL